MTIMMTSFKSDLILFFPYRQCLEKREKHFPRKQEFGEGMRTWRRGSTGGREDTLLEDEASWGQAWLHGFLIVARKVRSNCVCVSGEENYRMLTLVQKKNCFKFLHQMYVSPLKILLCLISLILFILFERRGDRRTIEEFPSAGSNSHKKLGLCQAECDSQETDSGPPTWVTGSQCLKPTPVASQGDAQSGTWIESRVCISRGLGLRAGPGLWAQEFWYGMCVPQLIS